MFNPCWVCTIESGCEDNWECWELAHLRNSIPSLTLTRVTSVDGEVGKFMHSNWSWKMEFPSSKFSFQPDAPPTPTPRSKMVAVHINRSNCKTYNLYCRCCELVTGLINHNDLWLHLPSRTKQEVLLSTFYYCFWLSTGYFKTEEAFWRTGGTFSWPKNKSSCLLFKHSRLLWPVWLSTNTDIVKKSN